MFASSLDMKLKVNAILVLTFIVMSNYDPEDVAPLASQIRDMVTLQNQQEESCWND